MWALVLIIYLSGVPVQTVGILPYALLEQCEEEGERLWDSFDATYPVVEHADYKFACINHSTRKGRIIERGQSQDRNLGQTQPPSTPES